MASLQILLARVVDGVVRVDLLPERQFIDHVVAGHEIGYPVDTLRREIGSDHVHDTHLLTVEPFAGQCQRHVIGQARGTHVIHHAAEPDLLHDLSHVASALEVAGVHLGFRKTVSGPAYRLPVEGDTFRRFRLAHGEQGVSAAAEAQEPHGVVFAFTADGPQRGLHVRHRHVQSGFPYDAVGACPMTAEIRDNRIMSVHCVSPISCSMSFTLSCLRFNALQRRIHSRLRL